MAKFLLGLLVLLSGISPFSNIPCPATETISIPKQPELILYYLPYCPYSQKVIKRLNSIHRTLPMKNLADDPNGRAELKEKGGKMQVPCLFIDGQPLYESEAIITWIDAHQDLLESD
ncbi:MAG TPA: glutaredoxin [Rhabdochlamydiaceae bacterium]|nr:glutaredoxin [Rhabdochlamydiaceae bacterium]